MKKRKIGIGCFIILLLIAILIACLVYLNKAQEGQLRQIRSETELERIYQGESGEEIWKYFLGLPFSNLNPYSLGQSLNDSNVSNIGSIQGSGGIRPGDISANDMIGSDSVKGSSSQKEYSTTNIQVENVDEADIIKTDGNYIYSLSGTDVVISDVQDPANVKIAARIPENGDVAPQDLMLYQDKLVVIYANGKYSYEQKTIVRIFDIADKTNPKEVKGYVLNQPYYTSRCIGNKLYVIATGTLRKENGKIATYYIEDSQTIDKGAKSIQYIKGKKTTDQTLISTVNLDYPKEKIQVQSYLMNIENAYVSEKNIYLLDEEYEIGRDVPFYAIWGIRGIFGIPSYIEQQDKEDRGDYTKIYKFNLLEDGTIQLAGKAQTKGKTINQFSVDEYQDNVRLAVWDKDGSRIVIFDSNMNEIGCTNYLAKGEQMYSSRFMGNRAYLVTYKTVDPLFAIDLSNPTAPKPLGQLKIPGYSTYLHPYDENHLIGIGMQTEEKVRRDSQGRVLSTSSQITGMKMALFDVSDIQNPIQMSDTIIGDRRTTSAILTNHKALLFSKEKELIAIPVNNYDSDFGISASSNNYSSLERSYQNYDSYNRIGEGYIVYKVNLQDGFSLKGTVVHENKKNKYDYFYSTSRLLRGVYIDDYLYTVSEDLMKVSQLEDLKLVNELKIKEE